MTDSGRASEQQKKKQERAIHSAKKESDLAERLQESSAAVMRLWETRVRAEVPAAQDENTQALRNELPKFLKNLAVAFSGSEEDRAVINEVVEEHGEQRALYTHYSAEQVIQEYRLFRESVFQVLERTSEVRPNDRRIINAAIDQAMAEATTTFCLAERNESERNFQALANSIPQLAWMADPEGALFWFNQRWYDYTGLTSVDTKDESWMKRVHHPDHFERSRKGFLRHMRSTRAWEDTFPLRAKDGSWRWFLSRAVPIKDEFGNVVRWFGTNTDVTEQRQAAECLRETKDRLELALKAAKIGVWEMDVHSPVLRWTEHQFEIFGVDPRTKPLTYEVFFQAVHPADRSAVTAEYETALRDRRDIETEFRILRHGEIRWIKGVGRVYFGPDQRPLRVVGTNFDITDSKAAIEERQRNIETLTRERDLRERFVNALTHDLRTPLTAAKMGGQLIARLPSIPDACRRLAIRVLDNIDRADEMITDLLDANRIRAGLPISLDLSECDFRTIVDTTIEELTLAHGERFVVDGDEKMNGQWDCKGIRRIVENLCANAVKYGNPDSPIKVTCTMDGRDAKLTVFNEILNDPISEEDLKNLFHPFHRAHAPGTSGKKGWGIGLTIVKGIAEAHGGSVSVRSDGGTTFVARLPSGAPKNQLQEY